jgi:hypothetical protein
VLDQPVVRKGYPVWVRHIKGLKIRFFDKHVGHGEGVRVIGAQVIYSKNVFNGANYILWSCNSLEALI